MSHALSTASASAVLESHPSLSYKTGDTEYRIERQGDQVIYQVERGPERLVLPIQWAFGVGRIGQTYVYRRNGLLYEARVSFYRSKDGLDITNGHWYLPDTTLDEAAGRPLSEAEVTRCFGCHDSPARNQPVAGVQCTACHDEAEKHAASFEGAEGASKAKVPAHLHSLNALEMANACGRCHRTYDEVKNLGIRGVATVRFQPYRLMSSRCFIANDERISCVACHNPHEEVQKNAEAYDSQCIACHSPGSTKFKLCNVSRQNCTSCHMPKVELPEMHDRFTDHWIRIVRKGEPYPS